MLTASSSDCTSENHMRETRVQLSPERLQQGQHCLAIETYHPEFNPREQTFQGKSE